MKEIALTTLNIKILFNILIYLIYNTRYSSSSECYYKHIYASMSNSIPTSQLNYVKKHLLEPRKFGRRGGEAPERRCVENSQEAKGDLFYFIRCTR